MSPACLLLVTVFAADASPGEFDWPQWRGPHRDGRSVETGLLKTWPKDGPPLAWKVARRGGGRSSPVVSAGVVYGTGQRDRKVVIWALDEKTGNELWATPITPNGSGGGGGPQGTPTVSNGKVYAVGLDGDLACVDAKTGKLVWHKHFAKDFGGHMMSGWGYSESVLIDGDKLICTPGGDKAAVVALNPDTGETIWKCEVPNSGGAGYASPVKMKVGDVPLYLTLLGKSGGILGVHADTGKLLFRYTKVSNGTANIPTPVVKGDLVFVSTGYGDGGSALLKLTAEGGAVSVEEKKRYASGELQNHHGGMILVGDHLYLGRGHNDGKPTCVEFTSADIAWEQNRSPAGGGGSAAVAYADGMLYFRYENGVMAMISADPTGFKLAASFEEPERSGAETWAHPVIANGKLYLRDQDRLRVYDVKAK
jgi:outer membrane protein assembly factor BamB